MKTLSVRLTLWYALVVTMTVAGILIAGRFYLLSSLISGIDFLNDAEFEEISHRLPGDSPIMTPEEVARAIRLHSEYDASFFFFQVGAKNGEVLFKSDNLAGQTLPQSVHGNRRFSIRDDELGHLRVGEFTLRDMDVHIASSLQNVDALFAGYQEMTFWVVLLVFLFSVAVGVFLSRVALNPVSEIQAIARRISADNLDERIPVPGGKDEISELCIFLNEMFDRIQGGFDQINRFTADASHELRTPLALIRLHSERLLNNPELSKQEQMDALTEQMAEIERLNKLVEDLLFIAKADSGTLKLNCRKLFPGAVLEDFCEDARLLCEEQSIRFDLIESNEAYKALFDPTWLRHVLLNLLSNALRFSPPGSTIRLRSSLTGEGYWKLSMEDEGPGVEAHNLDLIFERFQTNSRNEEPPGDRKGIGLGLAICRSIINQHNGRIYATRQSSAGGLSVHVELPAKLTAHR